MTGIDLTAEMIRGAKRTARRLGLRPSFIEMDAEKPEFPPESFDTIVTRLASIGYALEDALTRV